MTSELVARKLLEHGWVIVFSALSFALSALYLAKRGRFASFTFFASGVLLIAIGNRFLHWAMTLGTDSYLEALNSGLDEAKFWGTTFLHMLPQFIAPYSRTQILVIITSGGLSLLLVMAAKRLPPLRTLYSGILVAGIAVALSLASIRLQHGRAFATALGSEFSSPPMAITSSTRDIDLLVYIGESITTLNMQVYGYPLLTTPGLVALRDDPGLLVFRGVRSTHTHTTSSLLDALALKIRGANAAPAKIGIGDVLRRAAIPSALYSTQPESGAFAQVRGLIFDGMTPGEVGTTDTVERSGEQRLDHELLPQALATPGVVFFHSYAGHGPYEDNVSASRSKPVATPDIAFEGLFGGSISGIAQAITSSNRAAYDRAITYLDNNLRDAIADIHSRDKPAVFLFFSDHGESVYANRGHDSAMYIDEMTTVPVIAYFNEAYRARFRTTFDRFRDASAADRLRLLDQIAPSILEILSLQPQAPLLVPSLADQAAHPRPVIVERDTLLGKTSIGLSFEPSTGLSGFSFAGGTPEPTFISVINQEFAADHGICYHRANSFAKAIRAAAVTDCLEVDLVVEDGSLDIRHPPIGRTGFTLQHIFDIVDGRNKKVWIDGKNLDNPEACRTLQTFLLRNSHRVRETFVEFPPRTLATGRAALDCAEELRADRVRTSFYVPSETAARCVRGEVDGNPCATLSRIVEEVVRSGAFSDLSFDYSGHAAIKSIPSARSLRWNTWTIRADEFHSIPRHEFSLIIMDTQTDPNGI